jgi:hypothetical protein
MISAEAGELRNTPPPIDNTMQRVIGNERSTIPLNIHIDGSINLLYLLFFIFFSFLGLRMIN